MSAGHPPDRLSGDPCTHDMCLTGVDGQQEREARR